MCGHGPVLGMIVGVTPEKGSSPTFGGTRRPRRKVTCFNRCFGDPLGTVGAGVEFR